MARATRILRWEEAPEDSPLHSVAIMERAPGTGSIVVIKRRTRTYFEARAWIVDDLGNKVRKTKLCSTREAAAKALRDLLTSTEDIRKMKVAAFLDRWLAHAKGNLRPNTYRLYAHVVANHIKPHLKHVTVGAFRSPNARAFLAKLEEAGVSPSIRREVHKVLRRAFQVAVNDEMISRNPLATVTRTKVEKKPERILDQVEATRLLEEAARGPWHLVVRLALIQALREGEIFALTPADLMLEGDNPHLMVNATLTEGHDRRLTRTPPKTQTSNDRVEVDEETATLLHEACIGLGRSDLIFTDSQGKPLRKSNFLRRVFHPMLARAGLPRVTFHSLRKVANTQLIATGEASVLDLQRRLRHSTPAMTLQTYAQVLPGAQRSLTTKAADLFKRGAG